LGLEDEHARSTMAPFQELHALRSKLKGHASGEEAVKLRQKAIAEHGSYKNHFRNLCSDIDKKISAIEEAFKPLVPRKESS